VKPLSLEGGHAERGRKPDERPVVQSNIRWGMVRL
jgi:hypothetical protein